MNGVTGCIVEGAATVNCIPFLFNSAVTGFLIFAGMVALIIIVWGSIRLITSGGDSKQIDSARRMISFAVVGLVVVLSSFAIVNFVGYLTRSGNCINDINKILTGCN